MYARQYDLSDSDTTVKMDLQDLCVCVDIGFTQRFD